MLDVAKIQSYAEMIGETAIKGVLLELSCTPKPGLVDRHNNGANQDMDFVLFTISSSVLSVSFPGFAKIGIEHKGKISELLPELRKYGRNIEKWMFKVTGGVNTQKGLIFLMGLVCSAAGTLIRDGYFPIEPEILSKRVREITFGIVKRELDQLDERTKRHLTKGESLYLKYGIKGIRGEVEAGLPCVFKGSLRELSMSLERGMSLNDSSVNTLLRIITLLDDTNVMSRSSPDALYHIVRPMAESALSIGGMGTIEGQNAISDMDRFFIDKNINPGGSADILAVTIMIYYLSRVDFD